MKKNFFDPLSGAAVFIIIILLAGCEPMIIETEPDYIKEEYSFTNTPLPEGKEIAEAVVDYDTQNNSVFFSFETGRTYSVDHDVWDIAIAVGPENDDVYVVSNSGDYGENTRIWPFESGHNEDDYKGKELSSIQQVSFKAGQSKISPYQEDPDTGTPVANPLQDAVKTGRKFFLKVGKYNESARLYVIWFDVDANPEAGDSFKLHVRPCTISNKKVSSFGTEYEINDTIDADYSFNYMKLGNGSGTVISKPGGNIPKKTEWDLLFTRTNIYSPEMGEVFKNDGIIGSSSILINSPGGVEAAPLYGWDFPEVTNVPDGKYFKKEIDSIGHGYANPLKNDIEQMRKSWYYGLNMPPTFYLSRITYVIKCTDGDYGKFRPGSFYGPGGQKFYVKFRYIK